MWLLHDKAIHINTDFSMFLLFLVAARQCVPILADEIYGDMVSLDQDISLQ